MQVLCVFVLCPADAELMAEIWCSVHTGFYLAAPTEDECRDAAREHMQLVRDTNAIERVTRASE